MGTPAPAASPPQGTGGRGVQGAWKPVSRAGGSGLAPVPAVGAPVSPLQSKAGRVLAPGARGLPSPEPGVWETCVGSWRLSARGGGSTELCAALRTEPVPRGPGGTGTGGWPGTPRSSTAWCSPAGTRQCKGIAIGSKGPLTHQLGERADATLVQRGKQRLRPHELGRGDESDQGACCPKTLRRGPGGGRTCRALEGPSCGSHASHCPPMPG